MGARGDLDKKSTRMEARDARLPSYLFFGWLPGKRKIWIELAREERGHLKHSNSGKGEHRHSDLGYPDNKGEGQGAGKSQLTGVLKPSRSHRERQLNGPQSP